MEGGEGEKKRERLNGPLDQNDSCEEGSENKQGFRELLAALAEAITIIIIVIMFTVIICRLLTASPRCSGGGEGRAVQRRRGRIELNTSIC